MKIQYLVKNADDTGSMACSQCKHEVNILARLPLESILLNGKQAFIGLCLICVEGLLIGFYKAAAQSTDEEIELVEESGDEGPKAS